ncbi:hypothetical protein FB451DRAFT_1161684 [Mycena latifolia]|nr:hypothetical protein FB451DRAFT_1161684 [Mycena latifolia]
MYPIDKVSKSDYNWESVGGSGGNGDGAPTRSARRVLPNGKRARGRSRCLRFVGIRETNGEGGVGSMKGFRRASVMGGRVGEEYPETDERDRAVMDANANIELIVERRWHAEPRDGGVARELVKSEHEGLSKTVVQPCLRVDDWRHGTVCVESEPPMVIGGADGGHLRGSAVPRKKGNGQTRDVAQPDPLSSRSRAGGADSPRGWKQEPDAGQPNLLSSRSWAGGADSQKEFEYEKIYTRLSTEMGEEGDRGTHRSRRDSRSRRHSDECEWSKAGDAGQPKLSSSRSWPGGADSQKSSNLCKMSTETGEEGDRNTHHSREWSKAGDAGQPKLSSSRSRPGGADSQKSSNLCKMSTEMGEEGDRGTHRSRRDSRSCRRSDDWEWLKDGDVAQPNLLSSRSRASGADSKKGMEA